MRILIATGLYPPDIGGPATYSALLEKELPQHGIEVTVVAFSNVRHLPKIVRHILYTCMLVYKGWDTSVMYALDPVSVGVPTRIASALLFKPFILSVRGDYAWEQAQGRYGITDALDMFLARMHTYPLGVRVLYAVEKYVAQSARQVVVPSAYLQGVVIEWGVQKDRTTVIHNAFQPHEISQSKDELRKNTPYQGHIIASVGRLVPWKGFRGLIETLPYLIEDLGAVTLLIIGEGNEQPALKARAQELGVEHHVHFLGRLPQREMLTVVKSADVFVLNSAYEGLSHQLLEVMALGVPIVTTHVGGNTELITNEHEGLLVDYNDKEALRRAIVRLRTDKHLCRSMTERAQTRVASFNLETMITQTAVLFHTYSPQ